MSDTTPRDNSEVTSKPPKGSPIGHAMRVLTKVTGSDVAQKYGLAEPINRVAYKATETGFKTLGAANRAFKQVGGGSSPERPAVTPKGYFNLNPDDEQAMIAETVQDFASEILRPAAYEADKNAETPADLLQRSAELGITMINVPEAFDGAASERGVVTNALVAEAMAYGDMGLAIPLLAPSGVATTLTNFGSEGQQKTYLPDFAGEDVPMSAVVIAEPRPLFDAFDLQTKAVKSPSGFKLNGVKSFVPAAGSAELFIVGATFEGRPALFIVESDSKGLSVEADPHMGLRAAGMGRLILDDVAVPKTALLGEVDSDEAAADYANVVRLARLGWSALAAGTGKAMLDYVVPYVNEREAFGEPIAHRQAVAFMVANMATEIDGLELVARRLARRAGAVLRPRGRAGAEVRHRQGHADRPGRRPAARWPRLHQGAPGRALVPRPARRRHRRRHRRPLRATTSRSRYAMAINLELPKKFAANVDQAQQAAIQVFRPISRKYDLAEHEYPIELDTLAALYDGLSAAGSAGAGAAGGRGDEKKERPEGVVANGGNMSAILNSMWASYGDVGLMLSIPYQGLGNAAIAAVATDEQLERFGKVWASMAITEPSFGSDSAAVTATATRDGDEYVINGEKIFVTAGSRATHIVVWASVDRSLGRAAIKSFVVPREHPGVTVERLEEKLGIRASDTAVIRFENCRIPKDNILGSPEVDVQKGFGGVMQTFDNTRPLVAAMAVGVARAALEELRGQLEAAGIVIDYDKPALDQDAAAAEFIRLEAEYEAAYLHTLRAGWMADNQLPNTLQASMSKAKAGRTVTEITNKAIELCGSLGYSERTLIEKWARDSKILDIFEGTQQIQQLIVARRLLGKSSADLK